MKQVFLHSETICSSIENGGNTLSVDSVYYVFNQFSMIVFPLGVSTDSGWN
mgnify:CR=1 FL=1